MYPVELEPGLDTPVGIYKPVGEQWRRVFTMPAWPELVSQKTILRFHCRLSFLNPYFYEEHQIASSNSWVSSSRVKERWSSPA